MRGYGLIPFDIATSSDGSRHRQQGLPMLRFRRLLWMPLLAVMFVVLPAAQGFSQDEDMNIGDEPGRVPDESVQLPPQFQRQMVLYRTTEPPGTIIVHTSERFLYLVQGNGRAIRYGVRVGREGFQWQGLLKITRKAEWPDWTPPPEMIQRQPYLPRFMAGGPGNPLGARAMYLGTTVYRIHGTNQPDTIGKAVSSGCFGMVNSDIIDLYGRVPVGTKVVVKQRPSL
jgi:lipoprotein-anchoring transpeptidase ErfK/SrfK